MNASEGSMHRIGRTIWTVWGYLSGAVARYLRPEVTDEANQNSSTDDAVFRNTTTNRQLEESDAEKEEGERKYNEYEQKTAEVKCLQSEARVQISSVQWEKTDAVKEDNNELHLDTTAKQSYHCAMWRAETNQVEIIVDDAIGTSNGHKQNSEMITSDVQVNNENKEKQTKSEAHIGNEAALSYVCGAEAIYADNLDNLEFESETEQMLKETGDIEQKDGNNEDIKEEFERENSDGTEETSTEVQSELGQIIEQENLINKKDCGQTEDIKDLLREKVVKCVIEKEQIVHRNQEKTENDEDKGTESLVNDADLPQLGCSTEDEEGLLKPLENERFGVTETYLEKKYKNEAISTPERQIIDIISENVVEVIGTKGTTEHDKNIEEQEQCKWLDTSELASTDDILSKEEAHKQNLGESQTSKTKSRKETNSVEALPGVLEDIFEKNDVCNQLELKTASVVNVVDERYDELENTLQSDLPKQDSTETGTVSTVVAITTEDMFSDRIVCEHPGELRKGPEIRSVNTQALDQITTVATTLGSFKEIKADLSQSHRLAEEESQRETVVLCSVEQLELIGTPNASINVTFEEAIKFEQDNDTPVFSLELGTNQIQTLKELSLKECVQSRTEQVIETMTTAVCSHEKAEVFMTESQADNETLELNTEKECILSQATIDTKTLQKGERESSVKCEINRTELYAEDAQDVGEAKTALIRSLSPADVLEETLNLQGECERSAEGLENMNTEIRLLDKTEALETTMEGVEEMIEKENELVQQIKPLEELSTETRCDAEIQSPAEYLPAGALMLHGERKLLHDTVESLVEMEVETVICEAVKEPKDEHDSSSPECELTEADGGCEQIEKFTVRERLIHSHDDMMAINRPGLKRRFDDVNKDLPEVKMEEQKAPPVDWSTSLDLYVQPFMDSSLDFSLQKSRIAVKNPQVRPPKDPRKLLYKTSVEPALPKPPLSGPIQGGQGVAVSVQSKRIIGFKLPGMVTELPTLRKTEFGKKAREGEKAEGKLQEETGADTENSGELKQVSCKPKWTPPKHPGMGSPLLMAELKSKLKTPVKE